MSKDYGVWAKDYGSCGVWMGGQGWPTRVGGLGSTQNVPAPPPPPSPRGWTSMVARGGCLGPQWPAIAPTHSPVQAPLGGDLTCSPQIQDSWCPQPPAHPSSFATSPHHVSPFLGSPLRRGTRWYHGLHALGGPGPLCHSASFPAFDWRYLTMELGFSRVPRTHIWVLDHGESESGVRSLNTLDLGPVAVSGNFYHSLRKSFRVPPKWKL